MTNSREQICVYIDCRPQHNSEQLDIVSAVSFSLHVFQIVCKQHLFSGHPCEHEHKLSWHSRQNVGLAMPCHGAAVVLLRVLTG